jgi:hypothetical protein
METFENEHAKQSVAESHLPDLKRKELQHQHSDFYPPVYSLRRICAYEFANYCNRSQAYLVRRLQEIYIHCKKKLIKRQTPKSGTAVQCLNRRWGPASFRSQHSASVKRPEFEDDHLLLSNSSTGLSAIVDCPED